MNDTVLLTVKVQGSGNIDALPDPPWPEFQGWRVIESPAVASSDVIDGRLVGSRTYERVLVPEMAGELTVPGISFTYFDPDLDEYIQDETSPMAVSIAAVDGVPSVPPSVVGAEDDRAVAGRKAGQGSAAFCAQVRRGDDGERRLLGHVGPSVVRNRWSGGLAA